MGPGQGCWEDSSGRTVRPTSVIYFCVLLLPPGNGLEVSSTCSVLCSWGPGSPRGPSPPALRVASSLALQRRETLPWTLQLRLSPHCPGTTLVHPTSTAWRSSAFLRPSICSSRARRLHWAARHQPCLGMVPPVSPHSRGLVPTAPRRRGAPTPAQGHGPLPRAPRGPCGEHLGGLSTRKQPDGGDTAPLPPVSSTQRGREPPRSLSVIYSDVLKP